ncbi:hypothetical protein [Salipaludibacillus sp. CF4.18]|uniref:hypothetical protein n=1 Tax=Salipaludibacillus sp. CF4.18 TaxID=3373081 RepID=UPI003EE71A15
MKKHQLLLLVSGGKSMLSMITILLIVFYTSYFYSKANKSNVNYMTGKCISMALSMLTGSIIGVVIGIMLRGELAYATILGILASFIVGYFIGKPFSKHAIAESLAAGMMGGMMGAMLGEMLRVTEIIPMLFFLNILYIISIYVIILWIKRENTVEELSSASYKKQMGLLLSVVFPSILIGLVAFYENDLTDNFTPTNVEETHDHSGH